MAACLIGKYRKGIGLETLGSVKLRSKAEYGKLMFTDCPPVTNSPIWKETEGLFFTFAVCCVSLITYLSFGWLKSSPNASAKALQASRGNQRSGIVESIGNRIPSWRSDLDSAPGPLKVIDCSPTTRFKAFEEVKVIVMSLGIERELSSPPRVKLPTVPS